MTLPFIDAFMGEVTAPPPPPPLVEAAAAAETSMTAGLGVVGVARALASHSACVYFGNVCVGITHDAHRHPIAASVHTHTHLCLRHLRYQGRVDPLLGELLGGEPSTVAEEGQDVRQAEGEHLLFGDCVYIYVCVRKDGCGGLNSRSTAMHTHTYLFGHRVVEGILPSSSTTTLPSLVPA